MTDMPEEFKRMKIKKGWMWISRHKQDIHIAASIATIIALAATIGSLWWAVTSFQREINIQNERELVGHISDIESLELELSKNIVLMKYLIDHPELVRENITFERLIIENVKARVSDGKISNNLTKGYLIDTYFQEIGINNMLDYLTSPEISIDKEDRKRNLADQFIGSLSRADGYKEKTEDTLCVVQGYEKCLNEQRNIILCNDLKQIKYYEDCRYRKT